jgi:hypothetical protein
VPSPKIIHIHDADAAVAPSHIDDLRSRIEKRDRTLPTLVKKGPAGRAWTTKEVPEPLVPYRPILAYLLGPLAGFVTPAGRLSRGWTFLAVFSAAAWIASSWMATPLLERVREGNPLGWAEALAAVVFLVTGFLAWCRGLVLATPRRASVPQTGWTTQPWLVGTLGMIAPGLGLSIVGRSRRAAIALLNAGFLVLCVLVLFAAGSLWMGTEAMPRIRPVLEWTFLGAAMGAFLGAVAWVVLALEGVRLVPGPKRVAKRWGRWGDAFAVALLVSVVAFALLFRPAPLARQMDEAGVSLTESGYRLIPGFVFGAAMRLDPSQTLYVLHAAELEEAAGHEESAIELRRDLEQRIQPVLAKDAEGVVETEPPADAPAPWVALPPGMTATALPAPALALPVPRPPLNGPRTGVEAAQPPWGELPSLSRLDIPVPTGAASPGSAEAGAATP